MKSLVLLVSLVFLLGNVSLKAQYGINFSYQSVEAEQWQQFDDTYGGDFSILKSGFAVGIDRWFRLKNARVEFLPELNVAYYAASDKSIEKQLLGLSVYANTRFYLFDMAGDCDCPTFGKEGGIFKKGFFVELSPGVSYFSTQLKQETEEYKGNMVIPSIGLGIGLDLGISEFLTISPMIKYRQHFSANWTEMQNFILEDININEEEMESKIRTLQFGIRLGFRFDKL